MFKHDILSHASKFEVCPKAASSSAQLVENPKSYTGKVHAIAQESASGKAGS